MKSSTLISHSLNWWQRWNQPISREELKNALLLKIYRGTYVALMIPTSFLKFIKVVISSSFKTKELSKLKMKTNTSPKENSIMRVESCGFLWSCLSLERHWISCLRGRHPKINKCFKFKWEFRFWRSFNKYMRQVMSTMILG